MKTPEVTNTAIHRLCISCGTLIIPERHICKEDEKGYGIFAWMDKVVKPLSLLLIMMSICGAVWADDCDLINKEYKGGSVWDLTWVQVRQQCRIANSLERIEKLLSTTDRGQ